MSLSDEQWEFGKDIGKLIVYAEENGFKLTFGEDIGLSNNKRYMLKLVEVKL